MATKLVIVESPAKAKTIAKFLGRGYKVEASQGHVRDLPKSQIGVSPENDFEPKYITIRGRGDILNRIRKEARSAAKVYLATDPDREGEAISWHLANVLGIDEHSPCRIEFNEVTMKAVKAAVKNPRGIDIDRVNAQQARRVLDRLVGYKISPILWAKVKKGLSAGRVQSVAVKMICDRENEIDTFLPEEYYNIAGRFMVNGAELTARFYGENGLTFHLAGQKKKFVGFTVVYEEVLDDAVEEKDISLPDLEEGMSASMLDVTGEQRFTQPPPRYTEASLVRALEEKGIGRPSTYAPTISTIITRGYVARENKRLIPTELGKIVNDLMCKNFPDIVNIQFTADMEEKLDDVEKGQVDWHVIVRDFYGPFEKDLEKAEASIEKVSIEDQVSDIPCEKCGAMMVYKMSRYGKFLACPNFPACRHTLALPKSIGVACPQCGAQLLERISRKGRKFYGCERYPECDFVSWDRPVNDKCPVCGSRMVYKRGPRNTHYHVCVNESCRHRVEVEAENDE